MKFSWRAALCAVVMVGATGAFKACKSDGDSSGGEDPPQTVDDRYEVTGTATTSLAVLSNDTNLTHEPLTYSIEDTSVGSAAFNADHTVALTLPSGFKGVTKFRYKVTNSVGGFSISSAVVFVDVPAYRALFAARNSTATGTYELYVSDFVSPTKISNAVSGNFRLQNMWKSKSGLLVAYERRDSSTSELFFVKPTTNPSQVKFPLALNRSFIADAPVAIDDDSRWLAYPTNPTSGSGTPTNLYVLDSTNAGTPTLVGSSAGTMTAFTQWIGTGPSPTLYFMASPANINGHALFRAGTGNLDAPERVSPVYASTAQESQVLVSPDGTRIVIVGTHGGQVGAFFVDPTNPNVERRLTSDVPTTGAAIEALRADENVTQLTYLWRATNSATARLSVVNVDDNDTPQTVFQGNVVGFSDLRPDGLAALITRGANGAGSDGTLYEVSLDGSAADVLIASNVTGGVYADADRVYLFSRTLTPSVIARSDFERTPDALVRSSTPAGALFVSPIFQPTAAILEDPTSGVVLVNAAAPGKTLKLTDLQIGSVPSTTLFPTLIGVQ